MPRVVSECWHQSKFKSKNVHTQGLIRKPTTNNPGALCVPHTREFCNVLNGFVVAAASWGAQTPLLLSVW